MKRFILSFVLSFLLTTVSTAQTETVMDWPFDVDRQHWTGLAHLRDPSVKDGVYRAISSGDDPHFIAEGLEFPATDSQVVEFRYRTNGSGEGQLFFTGTTDGPFGGFSQKKSVPWESVGDEKWHTVRIFPRWTSEKKIVKLRIDFPNLNAAQIGKTWYEFDWIRVLNVNFKPVKPDWDFSKLKDGWTASEGGKATPGPDGWIVSGSIESEPIRFDIDEQGALVSIEMAADRGENAVILFHSDSGAVHSFEFPIKADGKMRWYNLDGSANKSWRGRIQQLEIRPSDDPEAASAIRRFIVSDDPQGPAQIRAEMLFQPDAINRAGRPAPFAIRLRNIGGETATNIRIEKGKLPDGVKVVSPKGWNRFPEIKPLETRTVTFDLLAEKPIEDDIVIKLGGAGAPDEEFTVPVKFEKNLNLPKADYVPEPKPVRSKEYEVSALYYGGWHVRSEWDRIDRSQPIRKPVLGWYDEANPECIDWQIKWAAENGIQNFFVCWYWNRGSQHKNHWVANFPKAKHKSYLKWCVMWANHNGGGSHSEEDMERVTDYWIENFFRTPEYYKIDGRPVVMLWSPKEMDDDIRAIEKKKGNELKKGEGVKRLLDLSKKKAADAGLKGVYFVSMKSPEGSTNPNDIVWLAEAGIEMTTIYHYMESGGKAKDWRRFDFQLVADSSLPFWEAWEKASPIPFLPNISSGWDDRPWKNHKVIYGRTVPLFRKILEDYKIFAARSGLKHVMLSPLNEWGEGSYLEPNKEFGFGMYEAVRETLCEKPAEGWPLNYGPADVGLGPYDLPETDTRSRTDWDFSDGPQGWNPMMGIPEFEAKDGKLTFTTGSRDPAISIVTPNLKASDWKRFIVRMKATPKGGEPDNVRLYWATTTSGTSEENAVGLPLRDDGEFHDYEFDLTSKKSWRRLVTMLRFDPLNAPGRTVEIESIRFE